MTRRTILTDGGPRVVSPEHPARVGSRWHAVVRGRVVDDHADDDPVRGSVEVEVAGPQLERSVRHGAALPRRSAGGVVGVLAVPERVFPGLSGQGYEAGVSLRAVGFLPRREVRTLGPTAAFPDEFAPLELGDIALHRAGIEVSGRVERRVAGGAIEPIAGATVEVTEVWRRFPDLAGPAAPSAARIVCLRPALYASRAVAGTRLRQVTLTGVAGQDKQLLLAAAAGDDRIRLSDRRNLQVGQVLRIDPGDVDREEHLRIAAISGTASTANAATITLNFPLALDHRVGAIVRRVTRAAAPVNHTLFSDPTAGDTSGIPGDVSLLLVPGGPLANDSYVEVDDGPAVASREYHRLFLYMTTTGADGMYRLPPIHRVPQLTVRAQSGLQSVSRTIGPAYPAREHRVDFLFA